MGSCFVRQPAARSNVNRSEAREPLLKNDERQAVNNLLAYLEKDTSSARALNAERLQSLCTLAYSDNAELQRSAALCFSEISERLEESLTTQMLEPLVHLLVSNDVEVQKAATLAISNFALHGPVQNKTTIVKASALPPLILLLSSSVADVQCNACGCITTLATTESNKVEVVAQGGIPPLLRLTKAEDIRVLRNAAGALLNLTHIEGNREQLVRSGGVPVFVHLLTSNNTDIQFYSAAAISNLAVHDAHRRILISVDDGVVLSHLIALMSSSVPKVCCQACLAVRNMASEDENQRRLVELGVLEKLCPLLSSEDTSVLTAAVAALRNISIHKGNEISIVTSGALVHLIKLLSLASHEEVVCHTAGVLRNLAAENQTKAIINAGCLDALTNLVSESTNISGPMLNEVSAALAVIASDSLARKLLIQLRNHTFCRTLLGLAASSPDQEVQYNCAGIIGHLATDASNHTYFLNCTPSVLDMLSTFLRSRQSNYIHIALWVTAQFANGSKDTKILLKSQLGADITSAVNAHSPPEIIQLSESITNSLKA
ncbi:hypothetical protein EMCRGX_G014221 [Ephydatia muelleri]|eukprot:Em0005g1661a